MPAVSSITSSAAQDGFGTSEGIATFLFSDIQGSTQLWEEQPDAMQVALAQHDALLQAAIEAAGGSVFKTVGDAFYAVFEQPAAALTAALAVQETLHTQTWPLTEGRTIRVRIALHVGPVERRNGDYFGAALSRTARLLAAAHGGQTVISEAIAAYLPEMLPEGVRVCSLGRHRLKDLSQPQEIFQVQNPRLPSEFPPLRSLESFVHNLPGQLTSFIGREAEMSAVRERLTQARLVTLTGTGGSGKTRLALQIAAEVVENYGDGVWLVELAALSDADLVTQEVAGILGIREESEKRLRQTLIDMLRPKSLLLVLDNCEHLIGAAAELAESLLQSCPKLSILATSREALEIGGEALLTLSSLSLPPQGAVTPEALADCESIRLFVERANAALPTFRFSAGNAAAVASVCARLDGIPLALELAAVRVKVLTPEQIDGRLHDRFRLLAGGSRTALPRQQTLRALVDWSYDLLSSAEQTLLCRLSVFPGGWSLEAAETVCAGGEVEGGKILDLLSHLAAKSLVVVEPPAAGQVRYHLLETIRSYSRERLGLTLGEVEILTRRHRDFFLALAEEAEPHLTGAAHVFWLDRLEADQENLRAALTLSQAEGGESLPRLAGALSRFWYGRSLLSEGMGWLEAALAEPAQATGKVLGKVLNGAGILTWCCGEYDRSKAYHARNLALQRALTDPRGIARALGNLSIIAGHQKQFEEAERCGQESLAQYQRLGDREGSGHMLINIGILAAAQGEYSRAESLYQEALAEYQGSQNPAGRASALHNLGDLFLQQGLLPRAKSYFRDSLEAQRALGNKQRIASTLTHLAEAASAEDDHARVCVLLAASARVLQAGTVAALPDDRQYLGTLEKSRAALGAEQFQLCWSQGHQRDMAQSIEFVLETYESISTSEDNPCLN